MLRRPASFVLAVSVACVLLPLASCGRPAPRGVSPLGRAGGTSAPAASTTSTTTSGTAATTTTTTTTTTIAPPATDAPPTGTTRPDPGVVTVAAVLGRYDRALTALGAAPASVGDPASPAAVELGAVLVAGSALADDVVADLVARRDAGTSVRPGPGGLSWVHRAVHVVPAADGRLSFTWCGWSPGIAVEGTGAVVDDGVAVSSGTGVVVTSTEGDRLAALDQFELTVEPPGTPDPCPATAAP